MLSYKVSISTRLSSSLPPSICIRHRLSPLLIYLLCGHGTFEYDTSFSCSDYLLSDDLRFDETIYATLTESSPSINCLKKTRVGHVQKKRSVDDTLDDPDISEHHQRVCRMYSPVYALSERRGHPGDGRCTRGRKFHKEPHTEMVDFVCSPVRKDKVNGLVLYHTTSYIKKPRPGRWRRRP
ncbi:hypothetical protein DFS33DRAFT_118703 [Desarmillaria ectypa]|nr:hypothetical protein DFS33DRAFT_118703 [Desarmillaria ectypa]